MRTYVLTCLGTKFHFQCFVRYRHKPKSKGFLYGPIWLVYIVKNIILNKVAYFSEALIGIHHFRALK
jgi:hypothetical protein